MDLEAVGKLKVAELKKELEANGLSVKGNKAELVERLRQHLAESAQEDTSVAEEDGGNLLEETDLLGGLEEELAEEETEENVTEEAVVEKTEPIVVPLAPVANVEDDLTKKLNRADRFNVTPQSADKKAERAKRFGLAATSTAVTDDKKKARAERFGIVVSPTLTKTENVLKKQQRAERFGTTVDTNKKTTTTSPTLQVSDDKILKRKERFGIPVTAPSGSADSKKAKRAERFGLS